MENPTYLRDTDLAERFQVSRSTIWRWTRRGQFPAPVKISDGFVRWRQADVDSWEDQRQASYAEAGRASA